MNIKYTKLKNNIVYTAAALGIVHNIEKNTQRFFPYHQEDIVSLDSLYLSSRVLSIEDVASCMVTSI